MTVGSVVWGKVKLAVMYWLGLMYLLTVQLFSAGSPGRAG